jgi:hypothetical protein
MTFSFAGAVYTTYSKRMKEKEITEHLNKTHCCSLKARCVYYHGKQYKRKELKRLNHG